MVEHSPEAIKIVRRYARVTPGTAQRMLDALLEQGGPDSLGDETAPTGRTEVTYQGLTHECQDPLCHVSGFVETLPLTETQPVRLDPSGPTVRSLVETLSAAQSLVTESEHDVDKRETRIAHLGYLIDVLDPGGAESPHEPQAWESSDDAPPAHRAEGGTDDGEA